MLIRLGLGLLAGAAIVAPVAPAQVIIRRAAPTITALSVSTGAVATSVTITGRDFGTAQENSVLTFNGTVATASAWSSTSITTTVPAGATTGSVLILRGGLTSNGLTFTVTSGGLTCTQTFTTATVGTTPYPGDNVRQAIDAAASGAVICFAAGTYGEIDLYANHPSSVVTLQPASGASVAGINFNLNGVSNVTITGFNAVSMSGLVVQVAGLGNNSNITFSYNAMTTNGVYLSGNTNTNANITITHNTFIGFTSSSESSRVNVSNMTGCPNGVTVSYNTISGGQADGLDTSGSSCGTQFLYNTISDILETNCGGIHCDGFQDNGGGIQTLLDGNRFDNVSDCFLMDDGSHGLIFRNNVCSTGTGASYWLQFGGAVTITLSHNTVVSTAGAQYGDDHGSVPSSDLTFTDNIFYSAPTQNPGQPVGGVTTINYNLCLTTCTGANSLAGTPTFMGGATPSTWAGFQLTSGSLGHNASSTGTDMGALTYGTP